MKINNINEFPKKFLWGAATSAFQIEGAYLEDGKTLTTVDVRKVPHGITDTKVASDHYHHYIEDVKLMAELGLKAYRFSISWARIYPDTSGVVNQKGIEFYNNLINELIKYEIEPIVTIYHFDLPQYLVDEYGGWIGRQTIDAYEQYAITLFDCFGDRVKYWITINEQLVVMNAKLINGINEEDPLKYDKLKYQMSHNMCIAEKKAIRACKRMLPNAKIGPVSAFQMVYPATSKPEDILAAHDCEELLSYMLLDVCARGEYPKSTWNYLVDKNIAPKFEEGDAEILKAYMPDFIGFNYYNTLCVREGQKEINRNLPPFFISENFDVVDNQYLKKTEWMASGTDPLGLRMALRRLHDRYQLPLLITENGFAGSDKLEDNDTINDDYRIHYIKEHLEQCRLGINEGVDLLGYCPWTFIDALSSHQGFSKRYGLVYINRDEQDLKDLKRIKKKSFYWYKEVIKTNGNSIGLNLELIEEKC